MCVVFLLAIASANQTRRLIMGGNKVSAVVPHMVYLQQNEGDKTYGCGGSLLSAEYVLTAAHCRAAAVGAFVFAGVTKRPRGTICEGSCRVVKEVMTDPNRKHGAPTNKRLNDLVILRLESGFDLSDSIGVVDLPTKSISEYAGQKFVVTGFGSIDGSQKVTNLDLREAVVTKTQCNYPTSTIFCAGGTHDNGRNACHMDSGGPLVLEGTKTVIGLVSGARGDETLINSCRTTDGSSYTEVYPWVDFIRQTIGQSSGSTNNGGSSDSNGSSGSSGGSNTEGNGSNTGNSGSSGGSNSEGNGNSGGSNSEGNGSSGGSNSEGGSNTPTPPNTDDDAQPSDSSTGRIDNTVLISVLVVVGIAIIALSVGYYWKTNKTVKKKKPDFSLSAYKNSNVKGKGSYQRRRRRH